MIHGISSQTRLHRANKIYLGEKTAKDGKTYPKACDHFVVPPEVQSIYGPAPKELPFMFPVNDMKRFFPQWLKCYGRSESNGGTYLICKGDGIKALNMNKQEVPCNPDACQKYAKKQCRRLANLMIILPEITRLSVYQIDTSSYYSIVNVNSAVRMILQQTKGHIAGLPLTLVLEPMQVRAEGKLKNIYVLKIKPPSNAELDCYIDSRKNFPVYAMPVVDESEAPEDLYPPAVLDGGHVEENNQNGTEQPDAKPAFVPPKARDPVLLPDLDEGTHASPITPQNHFQASPQRPAQNSITNTHMSVPTTVSQNTSNQAQSGPWKVSLTADPPPKPVTATINGQKGSFWSLAVNMGAASGRLMVNEKIVRPETIKKLKKGHVLEVRGQKSGSEKSFMITANSLSA